METDGIGGLGPIQPRRDVPKPDKVGDLDKTRDLQPSRDEFVPSGNPLPPEEVLNVEIASGIKQRVDLGTPPLSLKPWETDKKQPEQSGPNTHIDIEA